LTVIIEIMTEHRCG